MITICDSSATLIDEKGIDNDKGCYIMEMENIRRGRIMEYSEQYQTKCFLDKNVWEVIREKGIKVARRMLAYGVV